MYNTSNTLKHTHYLVVHECISWLFTSASAGCSPAHQLISQLAISWLFTDIWSAYPAYKIHSYKHLNILVILLFTCKVAHGSPAITLRTFTNLLLHAICKLSKGPVWYWELYRITRIVKSSARTDVLIIRLCLHSQANLSPLSSCL